MKNSSVYKIGDLLKRNRTPIELKDNTEYERITIRVKHRGVISRDMQYGRNIGTKKQFLIKTGQFVLSKIDARYGAFGIVPEELDGSIITGNFWAFDVNHEIIDIEWFNIFTSTPFFINICVNSSTGTTNRKYLDEKKFLNFMVKVPSKEIQASDTEHYLNAQMMINNAKASLVQQESLLKELNIAVLTEVFSEYVEIQ